MIKALLCLILFSFSYSNDSLFKKGNEAYQNRNYKLALEYYNQIEQNGLESSALYYNMGNAYYKLEQLGNAILYYEKAKKLSPLDDDVIENLKIANKKVIDHIEQPDQIYLFKLFQSIKYMFNINSYLWTVFILFTLSLIFYLIRKYAVNTKIQMVSSWLILVSSILFLVSLVMSILRLNDLKDTYGILLTETSEVYTAPDTSSQAFILHEGAKFSINRKLNDRFEVTLIDGKTGWIDASQVGSI